LHRHPEGPTNESWVYAVIIFAGVLAMALRKKFRIGREIGAERVHEDLLVESN